MQIVFCKSKFKHVEILQKLPQYIVVKAPSLPNSTYSDEC